MAMRRSFAVALLLAHVSGQALPPGFHHDIDSTTITAGSSHACVIARVDGIDLGGKVKCWGNDHFGQTEAPEGQYFVQVSAGEFHTCGITVDEDLRCWGSFGLNITEPGSYLQVSSGTFHYCAVRKDGTLFCHGRSHDGQLDHPSGSFVQVSCGSSLSCAIDTSGHLSCWGSDNHHNEREPPTGQFVQVSVGTGSLACAITLEGEVQCWGGDRKSKPRTIPLSGAATQVTTGRRWACAVLESFRVECFEQSSDLHNGNPPDPKTEFLELSAWGRRICGIELEDPNSVRCWGLGVFEGTDELEVVPAV